jgi:hypothetical protein
VEAHRGWFEGSKQWLWLEEDLRRVNRSATPWVRYY